MCCAGSFRFRPSGLPCSTLAATPHIPLVMHGYNHACAAHRDSPAVLTDIEMAGLHCDSGAKCVADLPFPKQELPAWADYMARRPVGRPYHR
jgi:hypothetical protein